MKRTFLIFVVLFLAVCPVWAQQSNFSIEELQKEIAAAEAEIQATNELLSKTEKQQKNNRSQLRLVLNNITNRKKIISSLDNQIGLINKEVNVKSAAINQLESELASLKKEYASMVRAAYKSQQTNTTLAFLFAAEDFNDMTQRVYYIKRYTAMRERKGEQIDSLSRVLQSDITDLGLKRDSLNSTVRTRNNELNKLGKEEQDYRKIDTKLNSQKQQYNKKIAEQQRKIKNAQDRIQKIIAEEARKSKNTQRSAAEEEAFVKLSGRFEENKGKLPYPARGVILERFGVHKDPANPNVTKNQRGIVLATEQGAIVRSVFDGVVNSIVFMPGVNNVIIIQHGNYYTAYSNLETISVKKGDKVTTNQVIGKVYSGTQAENYMLLFSISDASKNKTEPVFVNPELWLKR